MLITGFIVVLGFVLSNRASQEKSQPESAFIQAVDKPNFIDKSIFIKNLLETSTTRAMITAPRGSGKTTALDMIKRFLEIPLDDQGNPVQQPKTTKNYRIFDKHNLEILRSVNFVDEHFGQYPVILIDCQPLKEINCYYELLEIFKRWLREANTRHKYLLENKNLWNDELEKEHFQELMQKSNIKYGPSFMIKKFVRLCELLKAHFGKPVVLLFDDYDSYLDSPEVSYNPENDYIVSFIHSFTSELFKEDDLLGQVLITGVHRDTPSRLPEYSFLFPKGTVNHIYLDNSPFSQLFGNIPKVTR